MDGLGGGRVELAVGHAGARAHPLDVARADDRAVPEAVAMLERPLEHVRDDLHVVVRMRGEAARGLHAILVDDEEIAEARVARVVVAREREGVASVEPAVIEVSALVTRSFGDHRPVSLDLPFTACRVTSADTSITA